MTVDLVQRLRTCSAEERRAVAMGLAHSGTDEAVAELIKMIEGRHRKGFHWYNFDDQLVGVEALGETKSPKALNYLKALYTEQVNGESYTDYADRGTSRSWDVYSYPNARGKLAKALAFDTDHYPHNPEGYKSESHAHCAIKEAIKKLEVTVQNAPPNQ